MRRRRLSRQDVDQLLRHAFADDMPAEVEENLDRRLPELWRRAQDAEPAYARERASAPTAAPHAYPYVASLRRGLLAACALVMLIAGSALRIGHTSSFLAESFALRRTASQVTGRLDGARRMECRLRALDDQGHAVQYSILWMEGRNTSVEMEGVDGKEVWSVPAAPMRASIVNRPRLAGKGQMADRRPQVRRPIRDFLSAPAVADLLAGQWEVAPRPAVGDRDRAAFLVTIPETSGLARVVVDLHTYLPVSYAILPAGAGAQMVDSQPRLSAEFRWENPPASRRQP